MSFDVQRREGIVYSRPRAVKANCLDCSNSPKEVKACNIPYCHFWPYRYGSAAAKFVAKQEKVLGRYVTNDEIQEFMKSRKKKDVEEKEDEE